MTQLVLATGNTHKVREMEALLQGTGIQVLSIKRFPGMQDVEETAPDFQGNALLKAEAVMAHTGLPALADDSGLEVDYLNGAPGVRSARYSGGGDAENNALLLSQLQGVPDAKRTARFRCVMAFAAPGRTPTFFSGTVEGRIAHALSGQGGFGYDPLFYPDGFAVSFAEMSDTEKNSISHRGRAMRAFLNALKKGL